ncbi:MAG: HAD family hydrolase [Kordiimonadaceae bacterium]|nr:HAD family hydrolase [Kordiimonadaceae bacterium]MBO6568418.1 HAD family hydrolase [Kordiimonadaceae bacterium]MBO6963853.1 HAD family hydrolase [Kordiimonadaceae bacterium]
MPKRCVFLDRDGVLNKAFVRGGKSYPPDTLEEFTLLPGVEEACAALKKANFLLVVVTNQPDVATGKQQRSTVNAMHARLRNLIPVDDIFTCFHVSGDACDCRKPKPGMIFQASEKHDIDVSASYLVGDRWRDIEAGDAAGCASVFIDHGYSEKRPTTQIATITSLLEASAIILGAEDDAKNWQ